MKNKFFARKFVLIVQFCRCKKGYGFIMIDFEEELQKFQPSLEVEQAEDAIYNNDLTDVTDIIKDMMREMKNK